MSVFFFLQGSKPSDIPSSTDFESPLSPCPDTPNCVQCSREYKVSTEKLFQKTLNAVKSMNPHGLEPDSQNFQIDSVFRIRVFGFKDDLKVLIRPNGDKSILFIRSSSRVGHSDLGVNRRRVKRLLNRLNEKISL